VPCSAVVTQDHHHLLRCRHSSIIVPVSLRIPALIMAFKLWKTVGRDGRAIARLLK
jgi:hypothetical protein